MRNAWFRTGGLVSWVLLCLIGTAQGATRYSKSVDGVWSAPETWEGDLAPTNDLTTDMAVIVSNATITVDDIRSVGCCIVGRNGGTGTLHVARDFTLGTYNVYNGVRFFVGGLGGSGIGEQATGTTVHVMGRMSIGPDPGLTGAYALPSAASLVTDGGLWIGNNSGGAAGKGRLSITGGNLTVSTEGLLLCGGTMTLSNGTVTAATKFDIGGLNNTNTPAFRLDSGTVAVTGQFVVGAHGNSSVTQHDGTLGVNGTFYVGGYNDNATAGTGTYTQVGGSVTVNGNVHFNGGGKNAGIYNLDGGVLTTRQIVQNGTGTEMFNFNGGTLRAGTNAATFLQGLAGAYVKPGGAIVDTAAYTIGVAQPLLDGAPSGGLTKLGSGTLRLSGLGTFTGSVDIVEGTVISESPKQDANPPRSTLGNPQLARTLAVHPGAALIFAQHDQLGNAATIVRATVAVRGGTLGNTNNAFTTLGPLTLDSGRVTCRGGNVNWNSFYLKDGVSVTGLTASVIEGDGTAYAACDLAIGGTPFNVADVTGDTNADLVVRTALANPYGGAGTLLKNGVGTMTLEAPGRFTGDVRVNAGTLELAHPLALQAGTLDWNSYGGELRVDALTNAVLGGLKGAQALALPRDFRLSVGANSTTYAGVLSGTNAALTKAGGGTLVLTANSIYSGPTAVSGGVLQFAGGGSVYDNGKSNGLITVGSGGTLYFNRNDTFGIHRAVPATRIVVEAGGLVANGAVFTTLNDLTLNGGELRANGGANANYQAYQLKGTVSAGGTAPSRITATRSVNALTAIQIGNNVAGAVTTFDVGDVTASPTTDLAVATGLMNGFDAAAAASGLVKTGDGTLELTGVNTYSGDTRVTAGTLRMNGTHTGGGSYAIEGGTLEGTGIVACAIVVGGAGTLSAGLPDTPGRLTANGGVSFEPGAHFRVDISGDGADQLDMAGPLVVSGARLDVSVAAGYVPEDGTVYSVVRGFSNASPGTFDGAPPGTTIEVDGGAAFVVNYDLTTHEITLTAGRVKPGTVLLLR